MQIFLARNNVQAGPYSLHQFNDMLRGGQVYMNDLIWHAGLSQWQSVETVTQGKLPYNPELLNHLPASATVEAETPMIQPKVIVLPVASFIQRLAAKAIDLSFWLIAFMILSSSLSLDMIPGLKDQNTAAVWQTMTHLTIEQQRQLYASIPQHIYAAVGLYILIMLSIQCTLIYRSGQSIGKKLTNLKIIDIQGRKPTFYRIVIIRTLLFVALYLNILPILAAIELTLYVLRQQTLHDYLAQTIVIQLNKST